MNNFNKVKKNCEYQRRFLTEIVYCGKINGFEECSEVNCPKLKEVKSDT